MAQFSNKTDSRSVAQKHTMRLREMLRGRLAQGPPGPAKEQDSGAKSPPPRHSAAAPGANLKDTTSHRARKSTLLTVGEHLQQPRTHLARLLAHVEELIDINRIMLAYLPTHLRDHVSLVNVDQDGWTLQTDSPAWATRLRYCIPTLQRQLSDHMGIPVPPLRIRIVPPALEARASPPRRLRLSTQAANVLEKAAGNLSDRQLSEALLRLTKHGKRGDS